MNANPYAAPQTILSRFHVHELPMAEARGSEDERREFRDFSTEQLSGFMQKSRAIDKLQIFWLFAAVVATILAICWIADSQVIITDYFPEPKAYPWLFGYILIVMRFCAGIDRRRSLRPLLVGMDALLVCASALGLIYLFRTRLPFAGLDIYFGVAGIVLIGAMNFSMKSCSAAIHAPELFSKLRCSHARLCQELNYRKEYGIE